MKITTTNSKEVFVDKIRSYQTLVYKNGRNTFKKKEYTDYQNEITYQLTGLVRINDMRYIKVSIEFRNKNKVLGDLDNITKPILDILQRNGNIQNDSQIIELSLKKSFNHKDSSIVIEIEEI